MNKQVFLWSLSLILAVKGFTVEDELAALRQGPKEYASIHGMQLDYVDVETSDGWLLEVHRVRSMSIFNKVLSPPVVLSHGLGCSSMEFMANLRNESLAFILADRGYDVWAINHRATKFSNRILRDGEIVKPNSDDYVRATWQYMAERDMPPVIDKVLQITGHSKLYLAGQSMGGTVLFAFLSENHNYDDKILSYSAIFPVLLFGEDTVPPMKALFRLAPFILYSAIGPFFDILISTRFLATPSERINELIEYVQGETCRFIPSGCHLLTSLAFQRSLFSALFKKDPHLRASRTPLYFTKYPAGVAALGGYMYAYQWTKDPWLKINYDKIPQVDISNIKEYNQARPPAYDFANVRVPLQTFFSVNDVFMGPKTMEKVIRRLRLSPSQYIIIQDPLFSHHDANWGWDARCLIFDNIVDSFDRVELRRAGLNGGNTAANSSKIDKERADYRLVTVPNFMKSLQLQRTCPESDKWHAGVFTE